MVLDGKIALVTGAARGIGRATALILAEEGANCAVADIHEDVKETAKDVMAMGRETSWALFDISDPDQIKKGVERIRSQIGDIDILVNNAGIVDNVASIRKMPHDAWEREVAVNLSGAFYMIKELIGPMVEKGWGRIINISSFGATGGLHRQVAYSASKAGILGLTKTVCLEYARAGITCNAVVPGLITTEKVRAMPRVIREGTIALTPSRRLGEMREVGYLIAFLASERAGYINGAEIPIDGGARLNPIALGSQKEMQEIFGGAKK